MTRWAVAALMLAAAPLATAPLAAQPRESTAQIEERLPTLAGLERARALASLTDALKADQPARALAFGDEALRLFALHDDPVAHVKTLNEMAWAYMTLGRYDSALTHARAGQRMAEQVGDRRGEARSLSNQGSMAQRRGDPEYAVELFTRSLEIQRALGDQDDIANSLNNLGFVHSTDLADYGRALANHLEALAIRERTDDRRAIALSLNNLGIVYSRLRQYERALEYFQRALVIRRELRVPASVAATLSNIGDAYLDMREYDLALANHRESLVIREAVGDPSAVSLARRNLGVVHLAMGHPDSARVELLQAARIGDATGDQGLIVNNLLGLASVDRALGRHAAARRGAARALALAREMGSRELLRRAWEELSAAQAAAGDHASALASYTAFKALSDSIYDETTSRRVAGLERRADEERRRHEAGRLRAEAAMLEVVASRRATQRDAVAVVAVLLGLLGLVAYRRRSDRTRLAEELSMTDALTGARNRRYVQQILPLDVATSLRRYRAAAERGVVTPDEADVAIFLLDLDHFKQVNDRFGHAAGDRLLVDLAATLRAACREADVVARWGGEEFLVVSRFIDRAQASAVAERLRAAVESHVTLLDDGRAVRATCSLGYAVFPFSVELTDALTWEEVVSLADHGSYAAKRAGRNFWVGYTEGDAAPPDGVLHAAPTQVARWIAERRLTVRDAASDDLSLFARPG